MAAVQSAYSSSLLLQCSTSVDQKSSCTSSSSRLSLRSSFAGAKVRVGRVAVNHCSVRQSSSLQIMAVTKKAVAVLKGTTDVSGTVTLVQEDEGKEVFGRNEISLMAF
jgi:Cu-Zn family superoxide dismutase